MSQYIYQVRVGGSIYIGQARSAHRAMQHLGGSHNKALRQAMVAATVWPHISVCPLPRRCLGDLTIAEHAVILAATDRTSRFDCLNRTTASEATWLDHEEQAADGWVPLSKPRLDDGAKWVMHGREFCHQTNCEAASAAVEQVLDGRSFSQKFKFLPTPGSPIDFVDWQELARRVERLGCESSVMVRVNDAQAGDREPIGWSSSRRQISERSLKYWPPSKRHAAAFRAHPPAALVALIGAGSFRIVLGAWVVESIDDEGIYRPGRRLTEIEGLVVSGVTFKQSSYPIYWIREGQMTWIGHN